MVLKLQLITLVCLSIATGCGPAKEDVLAQQAQQSQRYMAAITEVEEAESKLARADSMLAKAIVLSTKLDKPTPESERLLSEARADRKIWQEEVAKAKSNAEDLKPSNNK
jgi:hypothetical protein